MNLQISAAWLRFPSLCTAVLSILAAHSYAGEPPVAEAGTETMTSVAEQVAEAQEAFLFDPTGPRAVEWRRHIVRLLEFQDSDVALQTLKKLRRRDASQGDGLDLAMLRLASADLEKGNHDRGAALLKEIVERYPKSSITTRAMLLLAHSYAAKKDEKTSKQWLARCAAFALANDCDELLDPENRWALPIERIADRCQGYGEHLLAFELWRAWSPSSWCGNGVWAMQETRARRMSECIPHIDDHRFLVKCVLEDAIQFDGDYGQQRLVALYADADQLLDLLRIAGELAEREKQTAAERKVELERIDTTSKFLQGAIVAETLRKSDDVHGLVRMLADKSFSVPVKEHVAAILGRGGDRAAFAVEIAIPRSLAPEQHWLLKALAANPSNGAFDALVKVAQSDIQFALNRYLVDCLAQRGDRGLDAVKQLASHRDPQRAKAARELLARVDAAKNRASPEKTPVPPEGVSPREPANKPKPPLKPPLKPPTRRTRGSLPKTLAEALPANADSSR